MSAYRDLGIDETPVPLGSLDLGRDHLEAVRSVARIPEAYGADGSITTILIIFQNVSVCSASHSRTHAPVRPGANPAVIPAHRPSSRRSWSDSSSGGRLGQPQRGALGEHDVGVVEESVNGLGGQRLGHDRVEPAGVGPARRQRARRHHQPLRALGGVPAPLSTPGNPRIDLPHTVNP